MVVVIPLVVVVVRVVGVVVVEFMVNGEPLKGEKDFHFITLHTMYYLFLVS